MDDGGAFAGGEPGSRGPRRRDLTTGPIGKTLIAFAVPTMISSVFQSLNGSVNAIWVGRFLGESALAATSNANLVMFLLMAFVFGFGMAATVLIGQAFGRQDLTGARRAIGTAIGGFVPIAIAIALVGWITAPDLLHALATPVAIRPLALDYLRVIFIAMPAILIMIVLMMGLRGGGDPLTPLWFMLLAVVLDSGLNPVFILGLGPAPELGIAGSAVATVIANYVGLVGLIVYIYARDLPLRLRGRELRFLKPNPRLLKTMFLKGLPMGLQMVVISGAGLATMGLVNREGVNTTAAFGVAMQLWTYVQMPAMALSAAVSSMAAQNIGAGRWDRVSEMTRLGIIYNLLITGALVGVLLVADRPALELFLGPGSPALPIARRIHLLGTWSFILFGAIMVLFGTIRANGSVFGPLAIFFIGLFPVRLGFAVALHPWIGADALWLSYPVGSAVILVMAVAFYLHGGWKRSSMAIDEDEAAELAIADREPGGAFNPSG